MEPSLEWLEELEAVLLLQDGTLIRGRGFGYPKRTVGEVVFNTGMVGYTEALTDPSYKGQILCFTYPLIGNYGVPSYSYLDEYGLPRFFESDQIQVSGAILHELCIKPSHWASTKSLHEWLFEEGIPGIWGVDTRSLTKKLRVYGVMMGALEVSPEPIDVSALKEELASARSYGEQDFVDLVSVKEPMIYPGSGRRVALIDCGVKYGILRELLERGFEVIRLPYNTPFDLLLSYRPDGVVVSNGPGDPKRCTETIDCIRGLAERRIPMLGICLGNQLISLALGGDTFKLKYGHRGQNKPCTDLDSGLSYVTSQNHGYAVSHESLDETGLRVWFVNADDKTVEGVKHESEPYIAVQFHPEASPGPYDTEFVFDEFERLMKGG